MPESTLRAEIASILDGVAGVGTVHQHERYSRSAAEWLALMESGGVTNGWTISRVRTAAERETIATIKNRHTYRIRGYYKLDDANGSEASLQDLLDAIVSAFNAKKTLNGVAFNSDPVTVNSVETKEITREYYVHAPELTLTAEEREWI